MNPSLKQFLFFIFQPEKLFHVIVMKWCQILYPKLIIGCFSFLHSDPLLDHLPKDLQNKNYYVQSDTKKGDVWLFNPKNVTIGSCIDQNKKCYLFDSLVRRCPFYMRILSFWWLEGIFHWKRAIFDQWVKKMAIFLLINERANGNIFRVKKSHISLRCIFF